MFFPLLGAQRSRSLTSLLPSSPYRPPTMRVFLLLLITPLVAGTAISVTGTSQQLVINHSAPLVTTFQGLSAVRHGFDFMAEEEYRGMNDTYRNISYARIRDARLQSARSWYAPDFVMPQGWGNPLDFTTPRFEQYARWVGDMKALNVNVVTTAGWWFTQNACSVGLPSNCTPSNASLTVYSEWISETAKELVVNRGLDNAATFLLFTEPLSYDSGNLPAGYTQTTYYEFAVRFLHDYMVAAGTRNLVKFMAPNGDADPAGVQACVDTLSDVIDIYSSHDYSKPGYAAWLSTFESYTTITGATGKPFVADEGGLNGEQNRNASDYGTYLALWQAALMNAGGSNSYLWLWQDQYYVWPLENSTNSDSFENGLHREWCCVFDNTQLPPFEFHFVCVHSLSPLFLLSFYPPPPPLFLLSRLGAPILAPRQCRCSSRILRLHHNDAIPSCTSGSGCGGYPCNGIRCWHFPGLWHCSCSGRATKWGHPRVPRLSSDQRGLHTPEHLCRHHWRQRRASTAIPLRPRQHTHR